MERVPGFLKAFVIASGAILVIGSIALAVLIVVRAMGNGEPPGPTTTPTAPVNLALPPGGRIEQVIPHGDSVLLLGSDQRGEQFLVVVDPATGQRRTLIRLRPAPGDQ